MSGNIQNMPLLAGLPKDQIAALAALARRVFIGKGQVLFFADEPARGIYYVEQGQIKLFNSGPDGREAVLHIMGRGEQFGETAAFGRKTYPATAMAIADSVLLLIPLEALFAAMRANPELAGNMLAEMSRKLRGFSQVITSLSAHGLTRRLAAYLLAELKAQAQATLPEPVLELPFSKQTLAGLLNTARETLSRALNRLAEENLIALEGRKIRILDYEGLSRLSARDGPVGPKP